jgi:HSP20 family protein
MSTLIRYEPLVGQLDGLFNDFFRPAYATAQRDEPAPIRFDVRETPEAYVVSAELPGVKKEDISVEIEGSEVTLAAESKRATSAENGDKWLRTERYFGKAARRFALPQEVDEAKAVAKYDNGLLELTLPKKAAVTGRKLSIQ